MNFNYPTNANSSELLSIRFNQVLMNLNRSRWDYLLEVHYICSSGRSWVLFGTPVNYEGFFDKFFSESDSGSEKFRWSYHRTTSLNSSEVNGKVWVMEMPTPASTLFSRSGCRVEPVDTIEENEPKEWVA
ncbi:hypothetical protein POM88_004739 [Heracleum sosnowskyi]|uniref:Uncharacterized protein n=1 Tax=Heracleum sosnowskyi TaxID=360622 RepID=A0AAD8JKG9_9APIA|nr:hypothetical protein POM88_004739 [Heracleum sosnowskyi]